MYVYTSRAKFVRSKKSIVIKEKQMMELLKLKNKCYVKNFTNHNKFSFRLFTVWTFLTSLQVKFGFN